MGGLIPVLYTTTHYKETNVNEQLLTPSPEATHNHNCRTSVGVFFVFSLG